MFKQKYYTIIDINSKDISAVVGSYDKNNKFNIVTNSCVSYEGYIDNEWVDDAQMQGVLKLAYDKATYNINCKISGVYVSVPSSFCHIDIRENRCNFNKVQHIGAKEIFNLSDNQDMEIDNEYEFINSYPIYYTVDGHRRVLNPLGLDVKSLALTSSYIYVDDKFSNFVRSVLNNYCNNIIFVPTIIANGHDLFNRDLREQGVIYCDIGYINTDVAFLKGDGVMYLDSLHLGGGHIAYDISYGLSIPFETACYVKDKLDFSSNGEEIITISTNDGEVEIAQKFVNMIAESRIAEICARILEIIEKIDKNFSNYYKIYITGSGVSNIKGVRQLLSEFLNKPCDIKLSNLPDNKSHNMNGLVHYVKHDVINSQKSFLDKFKSVLNR